jgi:hypothetical protein
MAPYTRTSTPKGTLRSWLLKDNKTPRRILHVLRTILHCPRLPGVSAWHGIPGPSRVVESRRHGRLASAPSPLTQAPLIQPQLLAKLHPHSPVPRLCLPLGHWRCCLLFNSPTQGQ